MDPKNNPFSTSDPNSFGSLWLANFGYLGFMEKPSIREVVDEVNRPYNHNVQNTHTPQLLKCSECYFSTLDVASFENHCKTGHKQKKMYPCHLCEFSTSNKGNLSYHISKHTGERPFKCEYCDHRARSAAYLKIHVRSRHTGEKPYSCPSCNFATPHSNALKSHIAAKHTGEKKYKCDMCDFSAVHSGNLKYHINAKHNEKPFKCDLCDYSAGHKGNLKTHMETKHTDDKKFKCPECEYSTGHQGNFKHHLRTSHGIENFNSNDYVPQAFNLSQVSPPYTTALYPYKCTQCPAYFHYPGKLVSHITEKHNFIGYDICEQSRSEERYKCSECGFTTDQEHNLVAHKNENHPAQRNFGFKCVVHGCSFIAYQEFDMDIHMKTSHAPPKSNCAAEGPSKRINHNQFHHLPHQDNGVSPPGVMRKTNKSIQCPDEFPAKGHATFIYEHSGDTSEAFKCSPCSYNTHRIEDFQLHLWANHPVEKPYGFKCDTCELFALDLGILKAHMKNSHPSTSQFTCLRCPELFYWNDGAKGQSSK